MNSEAKRGKPLTEAEIKRKDFLRGLAGTGFTPPEEAPKLPAEDPEDLIAKHPEYAHMQNDVSKALRSCNYEKDNFRGKAATKQLASLILQEREHPSYNVYPKNVDPVGIQVREAVRLLIHTPGRLTREQALVQLHSFVVDKIKPPAPPADDVLKS